jgi:hypothetical protein
LRTRRERPSYRGASEKRDEIAAFHLPSDAEDICCQHRLPHRDLAVWAMDHDSIYFSLLDDEWAGSKALLPSRLGYDVRPSVSEDGGPT